MFLTHTVGNGSPRDRLLCRNGGVSLLCSYLFCKAHLWGWNSRSVQTSYDLNPDWLSKGTSTMESPGKDSPVRTGYHRLEVQKTTWDVPDKYTSLRSIGSGAYGTVWWVYPGMGAPPRLHWRGRCRTVNVSCWQNMIYIFVYFTPIIPHAYHVLCS